MDLSNENYDDIIDLPHPEPKFHKRMPMIKRAAQFAPFAALEGMKEMYAETEQNFKLDGDEEYVPLEDIP